MLRACLQVCPLLRPECAPGSVAYLWVAYDKVCYCRAEAAGAHMQRPTSVHAPAACLRAMTPLAAAPPHTPAPEAAGPTAQRRSALGQMRRPSWWLTPRALCPVALQ